jgi:hypothetical protein
VLVAKKRISAKTSARAATKSGWRKPAVVRERTLSRKKRATIADAFRCHGGLTPAALGNVRLCTVNVVIFQPTGTVHQERLA